METTQLEMTLPTTKLEITHKPFPYERRSVITLDMVDQLYEGKGNCCRCGCGGNYFTPAEDSKKVLSALKRMASGKYDVQSLDDGNILEITLREWDTRHGTQTRVQTIYLKKNA